MDRFAMALAAGLLVASPALADDGSAHRCSLFCKVWRNVSGKVQTPVSADSWDDGGMRVPTTEEDARLPRTADLVVVHGDIIRKTQAERRHEQAEATAQIKRINALRDDGAKITIPDHATRPAKASLPD